MEMKTIVIKVHLHCEGCVRDVRRTILKIKGVKSAEGDFEKKKFTVKGTMNPKDLVQRIWQKTGKRAEVVKKKEDPDEDGNGAPLSLHLINQLHTTHLFSDENPHACVVM